MTSLDKKSKKGEKMTESLREEMERLDKKNIAGETNLEEFKRLIQLKKQLRERK